MGEYFCSVPENVSVMYMSASVVSEGVLVVCVSFNRYVRECFGYV